MPHSPAGFPCVWSCPMRGRAQVRMPSISRLKPSTPPDACPRSRSSWCPAKELNCHAQQTSTTLVEVRSRVVGDCRAGDCGCGLIRHPVSGHHDSCLLYTSDAADDLLCVDLGGRRIIK